VVRFAAASAQFSLLGALRHTIKATGVLPDSLKTPKSASPLIVNRLRRRLSTFLRLRLKIPSQLKFRLCVDPGMAAAFVFHPECD